MIKEALWRNGPLHETGFNGPEGDNSMKGSEWLLEIDIGRLNDNFSIEVQIDHENRDLWDGLHLLVDII